MLKTAFSALALVSLASCGGDSSNDEYQQALDEPLAAGARIQLPRKQICFVSAAGPSERAACNRGRLLLAGPQSRSAVVLSSREPGRSLHA